jgi:hypothetical protein
MTTRPCATENCERSTDWPTPPSRAALCRDCTDVFVRTGALPVIAPVPEWRKRLTAKDYSGTIYSGNRAA